MDDDDEDLASLLNKGGDDEDEDQDDESGGESGQEEDDEEESGGVRSDGEDEEGEDEEDPKETDRVLKKGRASDTIRTLRSERQTAEANRLRAEEENTALKNRLAAIENLKLQEQQQTQEQYLATLSPEERRSEELRLAIRQNQFQMKKMEFDLQDTTDRNGYKAKAALNDVYERYEPDVEKTLLTLREQGMWAPREEILANVIGKIVLKNKGKGTTTTVAKKNLKKNKTSVSSGQSDISRGKSSGNNTREARAKRLGSATF